jgi:hypothetical protein
MDLKGAAAPFNSLVTVGDTRRDETDKHSGGTEPEA